MSWDYFALFAIVALLFWGWGAFAAWRGKRPAVVYTFTCLGLVVFFSFIVGMWISLERPPMRTMGETRLWYSFFLPLAGIITYGRWKYKWILGFSTILSLVFVCINIFKPEIHNKTLMPALQSPWFTHSLCRGQIIDAVPAHLQQQKRYKQADQCLAMCRYGDGCLPAVVQEEGD